MVLADLNRRSEADFWSRARLRGEGCSVRTLAGQPNDPVGVPVRCYRRRPSVVAGMQPVLKKARSGDSALGAPGDAFWDSGWLYMTCVPKPSKATMSISCRPLSGS